MSAGLPGSARASGPEKTFGGFEKRDRGPSSPAKNGDKDKDKDGKGE